MSTYHKIQANAPHVNVLYTSLVALDHVLSGCLSEEEWFIWTEKVQENPDLTFIK
jgi:hypothetical protein